MKLQHRVALITVRDPMDISSWSGTQYHIFQQLQKRFEVVEPLGPVELTKLETFVVKVVRRLSRFVCRRLLKRKYNEIHSLLCGYFRARHFSEKIKKSNYSFVFASACSPVVAFLHTEVPIIYLSDATFHLLLNYYDQFSGLSRLSVFEGEYAERNAIAQATGVIMSSEWARQSAIKDYQASPEKVAVCLFGANIDIREVDETLVPESRLANLGEHCNLLFLARDWHRKGGQVALDAYRELVARGYSVTLTVCGCEPEEPQALEGLTVIPYLDKSSAEDRRRYHELMHQSHFLILPTQADCTPMVIAESNAYGMPVITSNTGGIPSLVEPGKNGFLLPVNADGKVYADLIIDEFFEKPDQYEPMVTYSRQRYDQALNWDAWGESVVTFIEERIAEESMPCVEAHLATKANR